MDGAFSDDRMGALSGHRPPPGQAPDPQAQLRLRSPLELRPDVPPVTALSTRARDDAGTSVHADAGPSASAGPGAGPVEISVRRALPLPPAPPVVLPAGEPADVAVSRAFVVTRLQEARALVTRTHEAHQSPDDHPDAFRRLDKLSAPAIVAALNEEHADLRLVYAHNVDQVQRSHIVDPAQFGSVPWDDVLRTAEPGRRRFLIDNESHSYAADVLLTHPPGSAERRASVIFFNPAPSPPTTRGLVLAEVAAELKLPAGWPLLMAEVPAQKSLRSCRIFALSMALKASRDPDLDELHQARLAEAPTGLELEDIHRLVDSDADVGSDSDGYDSYNESDNSDSDVSTRGHPEQPIRQAEAPELLGHEVLKEEQIAGPQFMKHAQSRDDVVAYIRKRGADALEPVNRKGQTLLDRHDAHRVQRQAPPKSKHETQTYSASIELKRLSFLDKAIGYAARCDGGAVGELAKVMQAVGDKWVDEYRH